MTIDAKKRVQKAFLENTRESRKEVVADLDFLIHQKTDDALFTEFLNSDSQFWIQEGLKYHLDTDLHEDQEKVKRIGQIVANFDLAPTIRYLASDVYVRSIKSVDENLMLALQHDPETTARAKAFGAFVEIQTDYWTGRNAFEQAESGTLEATLENAQKIVNKWKLQQP